MAAKSGLTRLRQFAVQRLRATGLSGQLRGPSEGDPDSENYPKHETIKPRVLNKYDSTLPHNGHRKLFNGSGLDAHT